MARRRSAIIPYRFVDDRLEILLITKSSGHGWGIPKGKIEAPLMPHVSAAKEAFEEAGVIGRSHPINVGTYPNKRGKIPVPTFLLEVEIELRKKVWPEKKKRTRLWVDADKCDEYVTDEGLLAVIKTGVQCLRSDGEYFKYAIKTFCDENQLELLEGDEDHAEIVYRTKAKDSRHVHVTRRDSTIKLYVSGSLVESEDPVNTFATMLLRLNSQNKTGFWCMEQVKDKAVYSLTSSVPLKLLDSYHFAEIIEGLIAECDALDEIP
jgi:8-oxo-dGTP pyrophosphatase MutT (NUDIX family)